MTINFISEVSSNHNQDLERSIDFVETSARIGCTSVKFQLFKINEMFAPEVLQNSPTHQARKEWELPLSFIPEIKDACKKQKIGFGCTPFYIDAVEELEPYVDYYKIASYELLWTDLLRECSMTKKPLIISTGMATEDEIKQSVETIRNSGCEDLTILHCVSNYPTDIENCNLASIRRIKEITETETGWSDHSVLPEVIFRAIHKWNAKTIEFHLDLEGEGREYDSGHCWLPSQIQKVISSVNRGLEADGSGIKEPTESELHERNWRADSVDGLRPTQAIRKKIEAGEKA